MEIPLKYLSLKNFRLFKEQTELELAPITLFVGPNNSGKSTVINALRILKESFDSDGRELVDLKSFLNTIIHTGTLRERYGFLNNFISKSSGDTENNDNIISISFSMKQPWLLQTMKISLEIRVVNEETESQNGKITNILITDENGKIEYINIKSTFDPFRTSTKDFDCHINQFALLEDFYRAARIYDRWIERLWEIDDKIKEVAKQKIAGRINHAAAELCKTYDFEQILLYAQSYVQICRKYFTVSQEKVDEGLNLLSLLLKENFSFDNILFQNQYEFDIITRMISDDPRLADLFKELFFPTHNFGDDITERGILIHKITQEFIKVNSIKIEHKSRKKPLPIEKLYSGYLDQMFAEIEEEFLYAEFIESIPEELKSFISDSKINFDEFREDDENLPDLISRINSGGSNIIDFECRFFQSNHENFIDYKHVQKMWYLIHEKDKSIFNVESILNNTDKEFVKKFKEFLKEYVEFSEIDTLSNDEIQNLCEIEIWKSLSSLSLRNIDKLFFPDLSMFAPHLPTINGESEIKLIKQLDFTLKNIINSEGDRFSGLIYHDFFQKRNEDITRLLMEDEDKFLSRYWVFNFISSNNLTDLISNQKINSDKFNFHHAVNIRDSSQYDSVYQDIIKNINFRAILHEAARTGNLSFSFSYSLFVASINQGLLELHNRIRTLFTNQMHTIPAVKTNLKRHISLFSAETDTVSKILKIKSTFDSSNIKFESRYVKALEIGQGFSIFKNNELGIATISLIDKNGEEINIADLGHGVSQLSVLSLLLSKIGSVNSGTQNVLLVEEPELSLHPSLQSKLADFFKIAKESGIQSIIETHSEYFVRKLQYLTKKGELNEGDVVIYYFNSSENITSEEDRIKKITIKKDGNLTEAFGKGFYDEANRIALDLLLFTNSNN